MKSNAGGENLENVIDQATLHGAPSSPYYQIRSLNGAMNAGLCGLSDRPAWCRGSEIGAWTNSAIAVIGCGEVYIPAGTYTQTTSIVKPRCVKLHGASADSTFLKWTPTHGVGDYYGRCYGRNGIRARRCTGRFNPNRPRCKYHDLRHLSWRIGPYGMRSR